MGRDRRERLFGAAVLLRRLESGGLDARGHEILEGVLEDLGVGEEEVRRFVAEHMEEIDRALAEGKRR